ncbi:hypothetical protein ALNOE001_20930 [Candidatus Methanobinarius endosymbioticus]|uniref:Uncharacterized protein n=1 Tax=Candidatus Methanobinarius endosymbioticus TaxID=2006182 RepID=A0A366M9E6_9EURY|nr:hypothetical protein ALNOE001_20930 [Candidatus Methanobinarius endosymbioticus]
MKKLGNITDHNSENGIELYAQCGSTFFKLPNGTIIEIMNQIYLRFSFEGSNFGFYHFYQQIENAIYDYYSQNTEYYYFESINFNYQYSIHRERGPAQKLLFDMLLVYNETGSLTVKVNFLKTIIGIGYYVFYRDVRYNTEIIKIYLNDYIIPLIKFIMYIYSD